LDVEEAPFSEKEVGGEGEGAPDAEDGALRIGSGTQMGDGTEKLKCVTLFLEGVTGSVAGTVHLDVGGLELECLVFARTLDEFAGDGNRGPCGEGGKGGVSNDLKVSESGAVIEFNEGEGLLVSDGPDPAGNSDGFVEEFWVYLFDFNSLHKPSKE